MKYSPFSFYRPIILESLIYEIKILERKERIPGLIFFKVNQNIMEKKKAGIMGVLPAYMPRTRTQLKEKTEEQRHLGEKLLYYLDRVEKLEKSIRRDVRNNNAEKLLKDHKSLNYYRNSIKRVTVRINKLELKRGNL